ncbi:MAG: hypothetical protein Q9219_001917 [cf. Caloplaca sp. 3 TL-2023]
MKQTLTNGWRFLTSKLHQPLPLDRRESQKLLGLLNDSFRRNLDRQYPRNLADTEHNPDDHFGALFKSPLFNHEPKQPSTRSVKRTDQNGDGIQVQDLMSAVKEPVEYFKLQVATGSATLASAKLVLQSQLKKSLACASADAKDDMKSSRIGSVVLNWLWSSGHYERLDFIKDRVFVHRLMPYLVVEGHYKAVWDWLQRSRTLSRDLTPSAEAWSMFQKDRGAMVKQLVMAEVTHGQGLQSAMQMFLINLQASQSSSLKPSFSTLSMNHGPAGWSLIVNWAAAGDSANLESDVTDRFHRSIQLWTSPQLLPFLKALVKLLSTRERITPPTLQLLAALEGVESVSYHSTRLKISHICLKAVEVLLARDSLKEAAQVLKALQAKFPTELGTDATYSHQEDKMTGLRTMDLLLAT